MNGRAFEIERFIACDYASQDANGKLIVVGIVPPEIYFVEKPPYTIPFFCVLTIAPRKSAFEFKIQARNPDKKAIFDMDCFYKSEQTPLVNERCNFFFQLPQGPFQGFGRYTANVIEKGRSLSEWYLDVRYGIPQLQKIGQVGIKVNPIQLEAV